MIEICHHTQCKRFKVLMTILKRKFSELINVGGNLYLIIRHNFPPPLGVGVRFLLERRRDIHRYEVPSNTLTFWR